MTQTNLTRAVKDVVLKNIYRQYYDLPNDQSFRKPDMVMRTIVETSETIQKAEQLQEKGLHPTLIFFSKELYENQI